MTAYPTGLRFRFEGNTFDLYGASATVGVVLRSYTPASPMPVNGEYPERVTESVEVTLVYSTLAGIRIYYVEEINRLLAMAGKRAGGLPYEQVWIEYTPAAGYGGALMWHRSPCFGGVLQLEEESLRVQKASVRIDAVITWERAYYWEDCTSYQIVLNNDHGSGVANGIQVDNCYDGTHCNFVNVDAADIPHEGALPCPVGIKLESTYATKDTHTVYMAQRFLDQPDAGAHTYAFEAESAAYKIGGASGGPDATCSNNDYWQFQWAVATEEIIARWSLPSAWLDVASGGYYRVVARFKMAPTSAYYFRVAIGWPDQNSPILLPSEGVQVVGGSELIVDLGIIRIPPWLVLQDSPEGLGLLLYSEHPAGGAAQVDLDFVHVMALDGFRKFTPLADGARFANTDILVDDGIGIGGGADDYPAGAFVEDSAGNRAAVYEAEGQPFMIWGERDVEWIVLVSDGNTGTDGDIAHTHKFTLYYRPRRITF